MTAVENCTYKGTTPTWGRIPYATTTYAYDPRGLLSQVTDALGNGTELTYDAAGRKTAMSDPDMGNWAYTYDAAGNLLTQTDARGQPLTFVYDALNRLRQKWAGAADYRAACGVWCWWYPRFLQQGDRGPYPFADMFGHDAYFLGEPPSCRYLGC